MSKPGNLLRVTLLLALLLPLADISPSLTASSPPYRPLPSSPFVSDSFRPGPVVTTQKVDNNASWYDFMFTAQ